MKLIYNIKCNSPPSATKKITSGGSIHHSLSSHSFITLSFILNWLHSLVFTSLIVASFICSSLSLEIALITKFLLQLGVFTLDGWLTELGDRWKLGRSWWEDPDGSGYKGSPMGRRMIWLGKEQEDVRKWWKLVRSWLQNGADDSKLDLPQEFL